MQAANLPAKKRRQVKNHHGEAEREIAESRLGVKAQGRMVVAFDFNFDFSVGIYAVVTILIKEEIQRVN